MPARRAFLLLALIPLALARSAAASWEEPFPYFAIGSYGSAPGSFNLPFGIAASPAGLLYVTDEGNGRVEVFDTNGNYLSQFGGNLPLSDPTGIVVHPNGDIYVAEHHIHRITRFTPGGSLVASYSSPALYFPVGIAVDPDGNLVVANSGNGNLLRFSPDGALLATLWPFPYGALQRPYGVAIDATGEIFVGDPGLHLVVVMDALGVVLRTIGSPGSGPGQFSGPNQLHFGAAGLLYIADGGGDRVEAFDPDGAFIGQWGSSGTALGSFDVAVDVASVSNLFFVTDWLNHRVQLFGPRPLDAPRTSWGGIKALYR